MYCHGKKKTTHLAERAPSTLNKEMTSVVLLCVLYDIYTHTHTPINKQVQSMQFLERTNSTTYPSRCGFKKIQIQLILRWLITTLNKVDDFVYYPLYQSLQRVSPRYLLPPLRITSPHYSSFNNHGSWQHRFLPGGNGSSFFQQLPWMWDQRIHNIYIYISLICIIYEI